jgi:TonB family protein
MNRTNGNKVIVICACVLGFLLPAARGIAQTTGSQENGAKPLQMRLASNVPRAISQAPPAYPQAAIDQRVEGNVVLHILIGVDGAVAEVGAMSGPEVLATAAIEAVKGWKYQPIRLNVGPVQQDPTVTLNFVLGPTPAVVVNNKLPCAFSPEESTLRRQQRPSLPAVDPDTAAVIRRLLELMGMKNVVTAFFGSDLMGIQSQLYKDLRPSVDRKAVVDRFREELQKRISSGQVMEVVIPIYAKHFTHEEIKSFLAFYESPAGKRCAQEAPSLMWEVHDSSAPYWMDTVLPEVFQEMSVEYPELRNLK